MKTFTINGVTYQAREFDFNTVCDLEEMGISLEEAQKKPMSTVRAYFALHLNGDKELAAKQLQEHLLNGGKFEDVIKVMLEKMDDSDFFRQLNQNKKEKIAKSENEEK